jgi:hypothetical protein
MLILPFAWNELLSKEILDAIVQHWKGVLSRCIQVKAVGKLELKLLSGHDQLAR